MEEILQKYFEVVTYKIIILLQFYSFSPLQGSMALINYNKYKLYINCNKLFFFHIVLGNFFVFRTRTTYCHICRAPTLHHTV